MKLIVFEKINELQDEKVFQEMIDYLNELNASRAKILNITNRIIEKNDGLLANLAQ